MPGERAVEVGWRRCADGELRAGAGMAERERARSEREFEEAVALYLRKRELTRQRAAAASSERVVAPSAAPVSNAPISPGPAV